MSLEPYREGHEYVVCTECQSHILLEESFWDTWPEEEWDDEHILILFTCDWEPCLEDFGALVYRPPTEFPEDLVTALGPRWEHA